MTLLQWLSELQIYLVMFGTGLVAGCGLIMAFESFVEKSPLLIFSETLLLGAASVMIFAVMTSPKTNVYHGIAIVSGAAMIIAIRWNTLDYVEMLKERKNKSWFSKEEPQYSLREIRQGFLREVPDDMLLAELRRRERERFENINEEGK